MKRTGKIPELRKQDRSLSTTWRHIDLKSQEQFIQVCRMLSDYIGASLEVVSPETDELSRIEKELEQPEYVNEAVSRQAVIIHTEEDVSLIYGYGISGTNLGIRVSWGVGFDSVLGTLLEYIGRILSGEHEEIFSEEYFSCDKQEIFRVAREVANGEHASFDVLSILTLYHNCAVRTSITIDLVGINAANNYTADNLDICRQIDLLTCQLLGNKFPSLF